MKRIAILSALLMVAPTVMADDSPLLQVADRLAKQAEDMSIVPRVAQDGRTVSLSYRTRKFMVHNTDKLGHHSEKAHEEVGPRYDGLIFQVTMQDGRYAGAAVIPNDLPRPYWTTFVNAYPVAKGQQHLHVNISYGNRTDREVIKKMKERASFEEHLDDTLERFLENRNKLIHRFREVEGHELTSTEDTMKVDMFLAQLYRDTMTVMKFCAALLHAWQVQTGIGDASIDEYKTPDTESFIEGIKSMAQQIDTFVFPKGD